MQKFDDWCWYGCQDEFEEATLTDVNPIDFIPFIGDYIEHVSDKYLPEWWPNYNLLTRTIAVTVIYLLLEYELCEENGDNFDPFPRMKFLTCSSSYVCLFTLSIGVYFSWTKENLEESKGYDDSV